jgi:glucose dehydrogenase
LVRIALLSFVLILAASTIFASFPANSASFGDGWAMFRYDSAHTGVTTGTGPKQAIILWSYAEGHFDGSFIGSSTAVIKDVVYVGSNEQSYETNGGNIYAFDAKTGAKIWNCSTIGGVYSSPAVSENKVFIAADANVYTLNASTGAKMWNYTTGGFMNSSPNVVNGVVYIGSGNNNVYALNASTGAKLWNYTSPGPSQSVIETGFNSGAFESSPAVVNGVVYIGSDDGNLYALNASTGVKIWNYTTSFQQTYMNGNQVTSSPAVSQGIVYVGSVGGNIYAFNATTGDKIWSYYTGPSVNYGGGYWHGVQASPAVANGVVYVGSVDGDMYALNASTGKQIWAEKFFRILSSAAVSGDVVYVGIANNVTALNATTGSQIWVFPTQNQINSSPAVAHGVVYISSEDGSFYALGETSPPTFVTRLQLIVIVIVVVAIVVVTTGLLVWFKKRNRQAKNDLVKKPLASRKFDSRNLDKNALIKETALD